MAAEFFEASQINKLLRCLNCHLKYDLPVLLPCGETICNHCVQRYATADTLKCFSCNQSHPVPQHGFPINKAIAKLITEEAHEFYRGRPVETLKKSLDAYRLDLEMLKNHRESSIETMRFHCAELRGDIQKEAQARISDIQRFVDQSCAKVDEYEQTFSNNYDKDKSFEEKISKRIKAAELFHEKWVNYLSSTQIDVKELEEATRMSEQFKREVEKEMDVLFKRKFNYLMVYNKNTKNAQKLVIASLGTVDVEKIDTKSKSKKGKNLMPTFRHKHNKTEN